jgi:hypothetical protein
MTAVELKFNPSAGLIQVVRRFVCDFYEEVLDDQDAVSRMALATHELLENAVKYALDGETVLSIQVEHEEGAREKRIVIRLRNRASPEHLSALRALFEEMDRYPDPFAHYQAAMERTAKRRTGSGLGIARVRTEGEMSMSYTIDGDAVCIVAQAEVQSERST